MPDGLLSVEEAQALAIAGIARAEAERVPLAEAYGRALAEDVVAEADVPPHRNSAMDGWAVRSADAQAAPVELEVIGESAAGHPPTRALGAGQAMKIMTGAALPDGADAVIMVERSQPGARASTVRLIEGARAGQHVREAGEDLKRGEVVLRAGIRLGAAEVGVLAAARRQTVAVARRPEVALLSTGDELREVDQPLDPGAIPETNRPTLAGLIRDAGGAPRILPIVRDEPALLRAAIRDAARADLVVSTGGVSVGEHDHVKAVLAELGATLNAWRVAMKPGKPVALARLGETPFFGLPGNPVSAVVSFLLFVRPAVRARLGLSPFDLPRVEVALDAALEVKSDRRSYLRAEVRADKEGRLRARLKPHQGSHVLTSLVGANALVIIEPGAARHAAGDRVPALLIGPLAA